MRRKILLPLFLLIGIGLLFLPLKENIISPDKTEYYRLIDFNFFFIFNWTCYYAAFFPVIIIASTYIFQRLPNWMFLVFIFLNVFIAGAGIFFAMFQLDWAPYEFNVFSKFGCALFYFMIALFILLAFSLYHGKIRMWLLGKTQS